MLNSSIDDTKFTECKLIDLEGFRKLDGTKLNKRRKCFEIEDVIQDAYPFLCPPDGKGGMDYTSKHQIEHCERAT